MIYLDYNSTTPVDVRVWNEMEKYSTLTGNFTNSSSSHNFGRLASNDVVNAKYRICSLLENKEFPTGRLVITSGATESNNLVLRGWVETKLKNNSSLTYKDLHIITSKVEHKCILSTAKKLAELGCNVTFINVDNRGFIDLTELENTLKNSKQKNILCSIIACNNEVGTIQNIPLISELVHRYSGLFHIDAAQLLGKKKFNTTSSNVDMVSFSAHKFYGPKGIGGLWIRSNDMITEPIIFGGGQEYGLRSGTLNVPGLIGMKKAYELCFSCDENERIMDLRNSLLSKLTSNLTDVKINGSMNYDYRHPGNLNLSFLYVPAKQLLNCIDSKLAISMGSACTSSNIEPSHVLKAMLLSEEEIDSSVRICVGRFTTKEDIELASNILIDAVNEIRSKSELWKAVNLFKSFNA